MRSLKKGQTFNSSAVRLKALPTGSQPPKPPTQMPRKEAKPKTKLLFHTPFSHQVELLNPADQQQFQSLLVPIVRQHFKDKKEHPGISLVQGLQIYFGLNKCLRLMRKGEAVDGLILFYEQARHAQYEGLLMRAGRAGTPVVLLPYAKGTAWNEAADIKRVNAVCVRGAGPLLRDGLIEFGSRCKGVVQLVTQPCYFKCKVQEVSR